jgi:hypothetical protein
LVGYSALGGFTPATQKEQEKEEMKTKNRKHRGIKQKAEENAWNKTTERRNT